MSTSLTVGIIVVLILLVIAIVWIRSYNRLIQLRNWVDEAFSQIDVQLQRRNDLIPNLVNTVKGYASHEEGTLDEVVKSRQQLISVADQGSPELMNELSNQLSGSLSRLLAVAEQYPDLKADTNFLQLQSTLETIEEKIAVSRQLYNSSVTQFNTSVETFPQNLVANAHHFEKRALLEAPEEVRDVPEVSF